MDDRFSMPRRSLLGVLAAPLLRPALAFARPDVPTRPAELVTKEIPSSGEAIPLVGMGTWITFNVGNDVEARNARTEVMRAFFERGGRMIDSSPMYGSAQEVIGYGLERLGRPEAVFSTDKVWISGGDRGPDQIEQSRALWGVPRFDLLQVHNLRSWEDHLETLFAMKADGRLRYVGITTSEGRRHREFERVMENHPLDFIQISYNIVNRAVEDRILPLAQERGIAVIANRPFQQGALIRGIERSPLPEWAAEVDAANWAQFLLKYIVSHPAVTCAIPATTRVDHVRENMGASYGRLPDAAMRRRMHAYVEAL